MTGAGTPAGPDRLYDDLSEYDRGRLAGALRRLTESGAAALEVARVSVWLQGSERNRLSRVHLYHRSTGEHGRGGEMLRETFPGYFEALDQGAPVVVRDAARDDRVSVRVPSPDPASGVTAWVDVPFSIPAEAGVPVSGVVRFEHLGPPRDWSKGECSLAESLGQAVGRLLARFRTRPRGPGSQGVGSGTGATDVTQDGLVPPPDEPPLSDGEEPIPGDPEDSETGDRVAGGSEEGATEDGGEPDRLATLLRRSTVGMALVTDGGEIRCCNPSFARMVGHNNPGRAEGASLRERCLRPGDWEEVVVEVRDRGRVEGREVAIERSGGGGRSWLLLGVTRTDEVVPPSSDDPGSPADGRVLLVSAMNITDRKSTEERLERLANRDPLTGVANRRLLQEAAENALALADRHGRMAALLYIDLRRFKEINDRFGHEVGDRVLTHVADRLRARGRESDLTARIGGDEFAVLLAEVEDGVEGARKAAERLMEGLRAPIEVGRRTIDVEVTIGIAVYPDHARDVRSLLRLADEAMYRGKAWDEGKIIVWEERSSSEAEPALRGRDAHVGRTEPDAPAPELPEGRPAPGETGNGREATTAAGPAADEADDRPPDQGDLELHWQPIQRGADGEIVGAEALLRGRDPRRGLLPAREFVERAKELGWIASFDRWVLEPAADQLAGWRAAETIEWIALNVAPQSLLSAEYMEALDALVESGELEPGAVLVQTWLDAEGTSVAEVGRVLRSLRDRGFGASLDLTDESEEVRGLILGTVEVDVLEVTPELLASGEEDRLGGALGEARREAGPWILAKLVESEDDHRRARTVGCELIQGHYVGRPVPAGEIEVRRT